MQRLFLTFFYSGLSPKAPGTVGTAAALIPGVLVLHYLDASTLFMLTIFATVVGIGEINKYEKKTGIHDDKSIVIDEAAGIWLALVISGGTLYQIALSFVLFRFFDIKKPSFIGRIDKAGRGGYSVMGDDLAAGAVAGLLSALIWHYGLVHIL